MGKHGGNPGFDRVMDLASTKLGLGGVFGICNDGPVDTRYEDFIGQTSGHYHRVAIGDATRGVLVPELNVAVVGVEEVEPEEGGHFLCIGMPKGEKIGTTKLEEALKRADDFGVVKVIVHPFEYGGFGPYLKENPGILERFDGFEVYNASAALGDWFFPLGFRANHRAAEFYGEKIEARYQVVAVSFTDGHSVGVIGRSYTRMPAIPTDTEEGFMKGLKMGIQGSPDDALLLKKRPARWDAIKYVGHMVEHAAVSEIRRRLGRSN